MSPTKTLLLILVMTAICGCSGVPVARVAALHRGSAKSSVVRELDNPGVCSCKLIYGGSEYELIRYSVGRRGDGYLFVFQDSRLIKVSREPRFDGRRLEPAESNDAAYEQAVKYIQQSTDILRPDDPPAAGPNWAAIELAVGWTVAMSPFLILDIPFMPLSLVGDAADRTPGNLRLNDPVATADRMLGRPLGECPGRLGVWRQYQARAGWFAFMDGLNWTPVIAVMSRDGRIVGVFSEMWLYDKAIPCTAPAP